MDILKKIFPFAFGTKDVSSLIIKIVIHVLIGALAGAVLGIMSAVPLVGVFASLIMGVVDLYVLADLVILILSYTKVLK